MPEANFYYYNNSFHVKELYNDTLFSLNPQLQLSPRYVVNLGEYALVAEQRYQLTSPRENPMAGKKYVTTILENKQYLFLSSPTFDLNKFIVYNKNTKTLANLLLHYNEPEKSMFNKHTFTPRYISKDLTTLISFEEPADPEKEDNPMIVLLTLKP
ncbi:hypothetical protein M2135_002282 [Parabacteroides sp. PF5-9]|nr:hypothetical protein [Parabacteroides sp. PF5-9]